MRLALALALFSLVPLQALAQGECALNGATATETPIIAGRHFDAGTATITNDQCDVILRGFASGGWLFDEAHAYVGVDPTPTNRGGNPAPGRFPYALNFTTPVPDFEIRVPLTSLNLDPEFCGQQVWIALHMVVSMQSGGRTQEETAWAFGPESFGKRWGWELPYTLQCGNPDDDDDDGGDPNS